MKGLIQVLAIVVGVVFPALLYSEEGTRGERAAALVEQFLTDTEVPGIAVSVGIAGEKVWSEGFGYADIEGQMRIRPGISRFRIGSVAKPLTAVAVAQLYEQGRLDLDAPVQRYVPSFPIKKGVITTRLLAGHLAGIRHYKGSEFKSRKHYSTVSEGLSIFQDDPLLHAPGSKYSYSSYGWNLISAVIESASDQDFLTYMETKVFKPIGMNDTVADDTTQVIPNCTRYYEYRRNGTIVECPPVDNSYKWASGGFLSTSEDLLRFGFAHMDEKLLKQETIALLWSRQETTSGKKIAYGIGWRTSTDKKGRHWVGHGGGSVGGATSFQICPDSEIVVVIIANMTGVKFKDLSGKIAALFLE